MGAATYAMNQGALVCDLVKDDLAALKRLPMSAQDMQNVVQWETLCNEIGTVITNSNVCTSALGNTIGANSTNANKSATSIAAMVTDTMDGADMYSAMAVLAAMCNYNPVIFLKYPPNYNFSAIGVNADSHNLSHRLDNAGMAGSCYPNSLTLLQTIDKWYVSKFAKLVSMLDSIKLGDQSTLLDSTAAVWFNEMSDGNAHNLNNLPIIQAGGLNGYFKTGWAVNVDTTNTGAANLSNGASESQCANNTGMVNGINQGTGTTATIANGPINKYYLNIMNAMGLKGDANGYPAKGGTAPVTKFGYSDKTEDFAGGYGAKPDAGIHSPGEYTAIKAGA
jgi:hypothetical protein